MCEDLEARRLAKKDRDASRACLWADENVDSFVGDDGHGGMAVNPGVGGSSPTWEEVVKDVSVLDRLATGRIVAPLGKDSGDVGDDFGERGLKEFGLGSGFKASALCEAGFVMVLEREVASSRLGRSLGFDGMLSRAGGRFDAQSVYVCICISNLCVCDGSDTGANVKTLSQLPPPRGPSEPDMTRKGRGGGGGK